MCNEVKLDDLYVESCDINGYCTYKFYDPRDEAEPYIGRVCVEDIFDGKYKFIDGLNIEKSHRDEGYGTAILEYVIQKLHANAVAVLKSNTIAYNMFEHKGFKTELEDDKFYYMTLSNKGGE